MRSTGRRVRTVSEFGPPYNAADIPDRVREEVLDGRPEEELRHIELRFWTKTKDESGSDCIEWATPARNGSGSRPAFHYGRNEGAHRVAYDLHCGELPEGNGDEVILHSCDNKMCVNPAHLSRGSKSENTRQWYERGSGGLTADEVREIRRLRAEEELTYREIGDKTGVHPANVGEITRGETYAWVEGPHHPSDE